MSIATDVEFKTSLDMVISMQKGSQASKGSGMDDDGDGHAAMVDRERAPLCWGLMKTVLGGDCGDRLCTAGAALRQIPVSRGKLLGGM